MPGFQWHCGTTISRLIHYRNTFGEVSYGGDYPFISITVVPRKPEHFVPFLPPSTAGGTNDPQHLFGHHHHRRAFFSMERICLHFHDSPGGTTTGVSCRSLHAHERLVVLVAEVPRRLALLDPRIPHHRIRKVLRLHANGLFTRWVHHAKLRGDRQVDAVNLTRKMSPRRLRGDTGGSVTASRRVGPNRIFDPSHAF